MRVTEQILFQRSVTGLQENLTRAQRLQEALATGKRINRPSDDPSGSAQLVRFETFRSQVGQYVRNGEAAEMPLKVTDTTLTTVIDVLTRVKTVAISEASGGSTPEERATTALQVRHAFTQLVQLANTTFNGQHVFAGFATTSPAYDAAGVYQGDSGSAEVQIAPGATVARNLVGDDVFGTASGGVDIFASLASLEAAITANDAAAIRSLLAPLGGAVLQVAERQAEVAARLQEIAATRSSFRSVELTVAQAQAAREDADMATVVTEFQIQTTVLRAVQESTARILQTSLLDFLR